MNTQKTEAIAVILLFVTSFLCLPVSSDTTTEVTGTFTPTGTLSVTCNNTAPAFGPVNTGESSVVSGIYVNNTGSVNATVDIQAEDGSGSWSLVSHTPTGSDKYSMRVKVETGSWLDAISSQIVSSDLPPGPISNTTYIALNVTLSIGSTQASPGVQTVYTNLTIGQIS